MYTPYPYKFMRHQWIRLCICKESQGFTSQLPTDIHRRGGLVYNSTPKASLSRDEISHISNTPTSHSLKVHKYDESK